MSDIIDRLKHMENGCLKNGMRYEGEVCFNAIKRIEELEAQLAEIAAWFIEQTPTLDVDWESLQAILEKGDGGILHMNEEIGADF